MSSGGGADLSSDRGLAEFRDRLSRTFRFRFALDPDAFVNRIREVIRAYPAVGTDPSRMLASLSLDDLYLATACANGEEAAWEEMASSHFPFIRDFALRCTRTDPPASDVAESVIATLWERGKIQQFAGRSSLRTWLGTVVARTAINALKRSGKTVWLEESKGASESIHDERLGARDAAVRGEVSAAALAAIGGLDQSDRLLLLLYYEQEMTLEQLEPILRRSKAAISRRLARVRRNIRTRIEAQMGPLRAADIDLARVTLDLARALGREDTNLIRENGSDPVSQS